MTPTVRRAIAERLPEAVVFAAFEFTNGPLQQKEVGEESFKTRTGDSHLLHSRV